MKYQVPQFIEIEDKIFGPLTFKQFIYLAGGAGVCYIFYDLFPIYIAVFPILAAAGLAVALAFYKVNNRPFVKVMESAFRYMLASKLYVWKKEDKKPEKKEAVVLPSQPGLFIPKLSESKLKDLTWSLDINETMNSQETRKMQGRRTGIV